MKRVQYFCNLCNEEKQKESLRTLYFDCAILPQRYTLLKDGWDKADKHICVDCISIIKDTI